MKQKPNPSPPPQNLDSPPLAGGGRGKGSARESGHAVQGEGAVSPSPLAGEGWGEGAASEPLVVSEGPITPYLAKPQQPRRSHESGNPEPSERTTLGQSLPIKYGKSKSETYGEPAENVPVYGSSGQIGTFGRRLTAGPTLIVGRKGSAGAVHYSPDPCWPIDTVYYAEEKAGAHLPFFRYLLESLRLGQFDRSTAIPSLSRDDYNAIEVCIPSEDEQRRIVADLETQLTRLDASVTALKRVQVNLKRYRASVLKAACEGRLVPTEAELARQEGRSYESGAELLIRLQNDRPSGVKKTKKKLPQAAAVEIRLPEAPEGWAWATVDELAATAPNSITDGPFGSNLKTAHYVEAGPRVIRLQNIGNGVFVDEQAHITSVHYERLTKHRVFAGDIVIAALGESPPRSSVVPESLGPAIVKADCVRFKPHELLSAKFLSHVLNSEPTRARAKAIVHGIGRPRLNLGEIRSISLPIPPLAEQQRIVSEVERRLSIVEEVDAQVQANVARSDAMRSSLLRLAFNSELSEMTNGSK